MKGMINTIDSIVLSFVPPLVCSLSFFKLLSILCSDTLPYLRMRPAATAGSMFYDALAAKSSPLRKATAIAWLDGFVRRVWQGRVIVQALLASV